MTEPEDRRPPVTIVDPNAAAGTADLLDSGPDPWRPSRRQSVLAAVVLLLVGLLSGGALLLRHVRYEQALDRQAVRQLRINISVDEPDVGLFPDFAPGSLQLNLFNDGPSAVHVRTVQLDDRARVPVTTGSDVFAGAATSLTLDLTSRCTRDDGRSAHHVTVRLTTVRGQRVTKVLRLTSDQVLNAHERQRCGTLTPVEALASTIVSTRTRGGWVQAVFELWNTSVLPLTLRSLEAPAGLQAVPPPLPLVLSPAGSPGAAGRPRQVLVRLRVRDCEAFKVGLERTAGFEDSLTMALHGGLEDQVGPLPLQSHQESGIGVATPDPQLALMGLCPHVSFS